MLPIQCLGRKKQPRSSVLCESKNSLFYSLSVLVSIYVRTEIYSFNLPYCSPKHSNAWVFSTQLTSQGKIPGLLIWLPDFIILRFNLPNLTRGQEYPEKCFWRTSSPFSPVSNTDSLLAPFYKSSSTFFSYQDKYSEFLSKVLSRLLIST